MMLEEYAREMVLRRSSMPGGEQDAPQAGRDDAFRPALAAEASLTRNA